MIILSPPPRSVWIEGKVLRGMEGYAAWAAETAQKAGVRFVDLNTITANKYDALGEEATKAYFNDVQHNRKAGAKLNAESVVAGSKGLKDCGLAGDLAR